VHSIHTARQFFLTLTPFVLQRWKLRLRPDHLPPIRDLKLAALPPATTCDGIFADFLGYVKEQLETYVKAKYGDGDKIWNACLPSLELVLTTPNGWELQQQQRMRAAAQKSELVIGDDSAERVRFVTEAEVRPWSMHELSAPLTAVTRPPFCTASKADASANGSR
jgi:hypothetical protein